jgi:hypothetical protein
MGGRVAIKTRGRVTAPKPKKAAHFEQALDKSKNILVATEEGLLIVMV